VDYHEIEKVGYVSSFVAAPTLRIASRLARHGAHARPGVLALLLTVCTLGEGRAGAAAGSAGLSPAVPSVALVAVGAVVLLLAAFAAHRLRVRAIQSRNAELARIVAEQAKRIDDATAQLAQQGQALEEANRRLETLSAVDAMTEVANRRQFDHVLDAEWRRCARTGLPLALVMFDIDYFKAFNDSYGHVTGDACLKSVAGVIRRLVQRAGELVARYGGEEFAVLLPGSDAQHARELAESIRLEVELLATPHAHSKVTSVVTVSAGVAALIPIYGSTPGELVAAANRALFSAKQTGRNRVTLAPPA
jgi:diguanylate cyclase (GGDEF)-like protein